MAVVKGWRGMGATRLSMHKTHCMKMNTTPRSIPVQSSPGSTRTVPSVAHQGGGDRYATGATSTSTTTKKIRGRDYISIATWNVRTLALAGRLQEVTHELDR